MKSEKGLEEHNLRYILGMKYNLGFFERNIKRMKQKTVDEESAIIFYAEHVEAFEKFFQSIYSLDYPWGIYNTPFMRINITDAKDKSMWMGDLEIKEEIRDKTFFAIDFVIAPPLGFGSYEAKSDDAKVSIPTIRYLVNRKLDIHSEAITNIDFVSVIKEQDENYEAKEDSIDYNGMFSTLIITLTPLVEEFLNSLNEE